MSNKEELNKTSKNSVEVLTKDGLAVRVINFKHVETVLAIPSNKPLFILISGTSESGKSHIGKKFVDDRMASRVKFYKSLSLCNEFVNRSDQKVKLFDFATTLANQTNVQDSIVNKIVDEYVQYYSQTKCPIFIVETIKHQWIVDALKRRLDVACLSVYIDASFSKRVERESVKTGIPIAQLEIMTRNKDADKSVYGMGQVEKGADIKIVNNGSLVNYNGWINSFEEALRRVRLTNISWQPRDYSN